MYYNCMCVCACVLFISIHCTCMQNFTKYIIYYQPSTVINRTSDGQAASLMNELKGEFCYVQTRNGKIASIHYSSTEDEEDINIKRGIAGAFQANYDNEEEVEETDPGSTHISHYRYVAM